MNKHINKNKKVKERNYPNYWTKLKRKNKSGNEYTQTVSYKTAFTKLVGHLKMLNGIPTYEKHTTIKYEKVV